MNTEMHTQIELGEITVDVIQKDIKNIHLSVYPPAGSVRISAPLRMDLATIRVFALAKLGWIKTQQEKLRAQEREPPREYIDRESHYVWGKRYLLQIVEHDAAPCVRLEPSTPLLQTRPGTPRVKRQAILEEWYRDQIKSELPPLIAKWEGLMGVQVTHFLVQKMKTKWGSCSPATRRIRLNTDLARKPPICLEYVLVHEMVHLLEPTHNQRFKSLMDQFMPSWRIYRNELNRLPVRHKEWNY